ncbi:MAG: hypothetical protein ACR2J4_04580 [Deinococcus sp.]
MSKVIQIRAVEVEATEAWIVTLDLEEVTQYGDQPMVFTSRTAAQEYAAALLTELGPDADISVRELDESGLPVIQSPMDAAEARRVAQAEHELAFRQMQTQINSAPTWLERRLSLLQSAVTGSRPLKAKQDLALAILTDVVLPRQLEALRTLSAPVLVARLRCLLKSPGRKKRWDTELTSQKRRQVLDDDPDAPTFFWSDLNDLDDI